MSMFVRCLLRGQADEKSGKPYSTVGRIHPQGVGFFGRFRGRANLGLLSKRGLLVPLSLGSRFGVVRVASDTTCSSVTWPAWFRVSLLSTLH